MGEGSPEPRTLPAPLTRRASGLETLPAVSGQPGLARPQDARVQPRSGALCPVGLGVPGASRPPPPRGPNRRLDHERPERRSPPSPAALTSPRRRPGSRPCPGRSSRFKPRAGTSPAGLRHRAAAHGGDARHSLRPREACRPAAPALPATPRAAALRSPRNPLGTPGGIGVTRGETRQRGRPPGPGDGRRGHRRLRVARAVGCAESPPSGWPQVGVGRRGQLRARGGGTLRRGLWPSREPKSPKPG